MPQEFWTAAITAAATLVTTLAGAWAAWGRTRAARSRDTAETTHALVEQLTALLGAANRRNDEQEEKHDECRAMVADLREQFAEERAQWLRRDAELQVRITHLEARQSECPRLQGRLCVLESNSEPGAADGPASP